MKYEIVPIAEEHIEGYAAAVDGVARERQYLAFLEGPPLERARAFVQANQERNLPHFVALVEGRVVGWCDIASLERPIFAHSGVLGMGVIAEYRGNGIGNALLRSVLESAKARGLTRIELTVREKNLAALTLYRKVGFRVEGIKQKAVRLDGEYENLIFMAVLF
jgi:ribosomal protein S18 acetylase RimI-like enzyme